MSKQRIILIAAGVLGMLSTILAWAKVKVFFMKTDMNLFDTDVPASGWILLALYLAATIFSFLGDDRTKGVGKPNKLIVLIVGIVALLITLLAMVAWGLGDAKSYTTFGIGIYLSFLTSLALVIVPFVIKDNGEFEAPTKEALVADLTEMKDDLTEDIKDIKEEIVEDAKEVKEEIEEKFGKKDEE